MKKVSAVNEWNRNDRKKGKEVGKDKGTKGREGRWEWISWANTKDFLFVIKDITPKR